MKIGRNDPCPCGSGKKFKKCCALISSGTTPISKEPFPGAGIWQKDIAAGEIAEMSTEDILERIRYTLTLPRSQMSLPDARALFLWVDAIINRDREDLLLRIEEEAGLQDAWKRLHEARLMCVNHVVRTDPMVIGCHFALSVFLRSRSPIVVSEIEELRLSTAQRIQVYKVIARAANGLIVDPQEMFALVTPRLFNPQEYEMHTTHSMKDLQKQWAQWIHGEKSIETITPIRSTIQPAEDEFRIAESYCVHRIIFGMLLYDGKRKKRQEMPLINIVGTEILRRLLSEAHPNKSVEIYVGPPLYVDRWWDTFTWLHQRVPELMSSLLKSSPI